MTTPASTAITTAMPKDVFILLPSYGCPAPNALLTLIKLAVGAPMGYDLGHSGGFVGQPKPV